MQIASRLSAKHAPEVMHDFFLAADPYLSQNGAVVDVGANIGTCTFELAALGHDVYAIEAVTANIQLMKATRHANHFKGTVNILHGFVTNSSQSQVRISATLDRYRSCSNVCS